jgi:prevent-host-death family protein
MTETAMTKQASIDVAEAKARLSALIDRAAAGEEIILCNSGRPVARLVPLEHRKAREPGLRRDWQIPDQTFLEPTDEEELACSR